MPPKRPPNDAKPPTGRKGKGPKFPQSEGSTSTPNKIDQYSTYRDYDKKTSKEYENLIVKYAKEAMGMSDVNINRLVSLVFGTGAMNFYFPDEFDHELRYRTCIEKLETSLGNYDEHHLDYLCSLIEEYMLFKNHLSPLAVVYDNKFRDPWRKRAKDPWAEKKGTEATLRSILITTDEHARQSRLDHSRAGGLQREPDSDEELPDSDEEFNEFDDEFE